MGRQRVVFQYVGDTWSVFPLQKKVVAKVRA